MNFKKIKPFIKPIIRFLFLVVALLCALAGPLPDWLYKLVSSEDFIETPTIFPHWAVRVLPSSSFMTPFHGVIVHRHLFMEIFWLIAPLLLFAAAFFYGRVFCRYCCPLGTLYSLPSSVGAKKKLFRIPLSGIIFWVSLFSALSGFSIFLFLDPLSTFSRLSAPINGILSFEILVINCVFILFFLLSFFQPMLWCSHFCPLGYIMGFIRKSPKGYAEKFKRDRRKILVGLGIGLPAGLLARNLKIFRGTSTEYPLLPPGAVDADAFAASCTRCYACVNSCPTSILHVKSPNDANFAAWFEPQMDPDKGACEEFCNACTQACPAGSIRRLSVEQKRLTQIGVAKVVRKACLAWEDNEFCMVCDEYCPYNAIENDEGDNGIPRPIVNPERCRGCGFCQRYCPAVREGKAIFVHGIAKQRRIKK